MGVSKASLRGLRMNERMEKIREASKAMVRTVRVSPANDTMRRLLKHPRAGGFGKEGSVEWPDDRFTKRRLNDGDITREEKQTEENRPPPRQHRTEEEPNNAA
jgi:hypothetical protein